MPLITLGDDTKLKLKIPSKGDVDWSDDFKTQFAQKIVDHDHSGVDGKGAQLTGDALADGAINRSSLLAINLEDLPNVRNTLNAQGDSNYSNGDALLYDAGTGLWEPQAPTSDITTVNTTVSIPNPGQGATSPYGRGIIVLTTDIDNGLNDNERRILNFTNNRSVDISEYAGITFIIDDVAPAGKTVKFPDLVNCTVVSNVNVQFHGNVKNCKILVRRPNGTAETSLVNNGRFEGSVCDLDELVSAGHASSLTRFVQSSITADILETQMTGTDVENIEKTNLKVGNLLNNTALSTGALRLNLTDKSSLDAKSIANSIIIDGTTVSLSDNSKLTTLSSIGSSNGQIVKTWDDTANRWQYLVSPSGTGKVIVSDNDEPSEVDFTLGNLTNVNLTSPADNQVLTYSGGNWIDNKKLQVNVTGNKDIVTTATTSGQVLQYNGTKFVAQSLPSFVENVEHTLTFTYTIDKEPSSFPPIHVDSIKSKIESSLSANNISIGTIQKITYTSGTFDINGGMAEFYLRDAKGDHYALYRHSLHSTYFSQVDSSLSNLNASYAVSFNDSTTQYRNGNLTGSDITLYDASMAGATPTNLGIVAASRYLEDNANTNAIFVFVLKIYAFTGTVTTSVSSQSFTT